MLAAFINSPERQAALEANRLRIERELPQAMAREACRAAKRRKPKPQRIPWSLRPQLMLAARIDRLNLMARHIGWRTH